MSALKCAIILICISALALTFADAMPMFYKKNDQKNYEADLVPVSSTVIPLTYDHDLKEHKLSQVEYKEIYLKHFHKKVAEPHHQEGLITVKNIHKKE